ncbi:MAG: nickel-responsive transcriptional regulator NikR [Candidatus Heimdallarchaeota archaeon]|nr:nickel-responsive transcriptional regulator NikR [Candidatus Heimdallarchaeota archaeon]
MSNNVVKDVVTRTGISLDPSLLSEFDSWLADKKFPNRSEGIRYLIREKLDQEVLLSTPESIVVGSLTYIFDHHTFDCTLKLIEIQHNFEDLIISTMHAHITHNLCLETIFLRGQQHSVQKLSDSILALKGVLKGQLYLVPSE